MTDPTSGSKLTTEVRASNFDHVFDHVFFKYDKETLSYDVTAEIRRDGFDPRNISKLEDRNIKDDRNGGEQYQVPNVVHYTWFGANFDFTFINYLSFLSVHKILKPESIFIFGNVLPRGRWWDRTVEEVSNLIFVYKEMPTVALNGEPFKFVAHSSDFVRLEVVLSEYVYGNLIRLYKLYYRLLQLMDDDSENIMMTLDEDCYRR